jgi:hypothetical protein
VGELHAFYRYGPIGFVALSAVLGAALTPRFVRLADVLKQKALDRRLRRYGLPRSTLSGVADGETISFFGVLGSGTAKRYELALEHAEDTHDTVRLVSDLEVLFDGRRLPLVDDVMIEGGSDEVVSGTSRWRRLSIGDRVHVTGAVALGEAMVGSFRENAREARLVGAPMTPIRVAYAGVAPFRRPRLVKVAATLASAVSIWIAASIVALLLLLLPAGEVAGRLPGDHVDATLVAHAVPPVSRLAARRLARRLEEAGGVGRFAPPGALEARLEQASHVDETPEASLERWLRFGYPSRAGKVALGNPSVGTCGRGLFAFADAVRVGGVAQLRLSCASLPSDEAADAAFMIGDFASGRGPEPETIVFRQPLVPFDGAPCLAGGDVVPPAKEPLCVLAHAEMKPKKRRELLLGLSGLGTFPSRWVASARALEGDPLPHEVAFTIDPERFVTRPIAALFDQPLAVELELAEKVEKGERSLPAADGVWLVLAHAAELSAFGHHDRAMRKVEEVLASDRFRELAEGDAASTRRLAAAIAVRAGDAAKARDFLGDAARGAPRLAALVAFAEDPARGESPTTTSLGAIDGPRFAASLAEIGDARSKESERLVLGGLPLALRAVPEAERPALREWAREAFPRFRGARFFARAEVLAARLDAARSLGDGELVADLEPILGRFEAVLVNRTLGFSLRAGTSALPDPAD